MQQLLALLEQELGPPCDSDRPLVSSGLVDSLHFEELVQALERHYGVSIDPSLIGVDNFDTPAQMLAYLQRAP